MLHLDENPILKVKNVAKLYAENKGCQGIDFELYAGEVLGIVGESGSGKSTLLKLLSGQLQADAGEVLYVDRAANVHSLFSMPISDQRHLLRTEWGVVHQHPSDGLRMNISAGGNIGERLMAIGERHYGEIRTQSIEWMGSVELSSDRVDDKPSQFSGGMQQRLQIAKNLVTKPRLVFMDEPTGGLDVSVQAKFLDLLRRLVMELNVAVIFVTHDLGVARLLSDRLMVMRQSKVVEQGLTDQILDDPQHAYTQLLVSSIVR